MCLRLACGCLTVVYCKRGACFNGGMTTATLTTVEADDKITLAQATHITPGRPSPSCLWRWCRQGVKARTGHRVKLRHVRVGARVFTSKIWLDEFFTALAEADAAYFDRPKPAINNIEKPRTSAQRERAIAAAERRLTAAGA